MAATRQQKFPLNRPVARTPPLSLHAAIVTFKPEDC